MPPPERSSALFQPRYILHGRDSCHDEAVKVQVVIMRRGSEGCGCGGATDQR